MIKNVKNTLRNHETMFQKWLSNPNVITFFLNGILYISLGPNLSFRKDISAPRCIHEYAK